MNETIHFRDFTKKRVPVEFKIDDDTFHCVRALSPTQLERIVTVVRSARSDTENEELRSVNIAAHMNRLKDIFKIFLKKKSYERFVERLGNFSEDEVVAIDVEDEDVKENDMIDLEQLLGITKWILEVYTGRPTQPSSSSSDGSPTDDAGTSSTAGPLHPASIPLS